MSKALKILSRPKGNAEEYGRWSVNAFVGCPHGCEYCYLKKGPSGAYLGQDKPVLKKGVVNDEHAYHLAMAEIIENRDEIIRDGGLFMTFTSDPCAEQTRYLSLSIAHDASYQMHIPVMILTKNATFLDIDPYDSKLLGIDKTEEWRRSIPFYHTGNGRLSFIDNPHFTTDADPIAFGFTLTGHDELEPKASPNTDRINALQRLTERGFKTWASIEPVIDFPSSLDMIYQALNAGCEHFKIGLLTNNTRVVRKDFHIGEYQFKAYDVIDCMHFIEDVMRLTSGKATVYWKQSVRDLLETIYTPAAVDELLNYPHSVGKDWSIFKKED
jgi:DNA repair photolyase